MRERRVRNDVGERDVSLELVLTLRLRRYRNAARCTGRRLVARRDGDRQPQRLNSLEGEPQLGARLSLFERGHPEPAGADALSQLRLREASGHAGFAHQRANRCRIEECGHVRVC